MALYPYSDRHWMGVHGDPDFPGLAVRAFVAPDIPTATHISTGDRIYRFTENKYLYGFIIALAIPSCALGMTCGIKAWIIKVSVHSVLRAWPKAYFSL